MPFYIFHLNNNPVSITAVYSSSALTPRPLNFAQFLSVFYDVQYRHADTTWTDIVRDDYSTFHVADYDPDTGDLVDQGICTPSHTSYIYT